LESRCAIGVKLTFILKRMNVNEPIFLIVGLGNPGPEYRDNRHNAGFMLVSRLAERLGTTFARLESKALVAKAHYQPEGSESLRIILAKPQTYMNLSGQAVASLVRFYKLPLEHLLVVHDDVDLPFGTLRLRPGGGSGGQKGVESIIQFLGTQEFPRLRMGVDRPTGRMEAGDYVLQDFPESEASFLPAILNQGADAALEFVINGLESAMNCYNGILS
jgi:PTH1 family peptidyl-tRNA hydrolase